MILLPPAEGLAPREPPWGCDDPFRVRQGVATFRAFVLEFFGGSDLGIGRDCKVGSPSHHWQGAAWDWGPPLDGDDLVTTGARRTQSAAKLLALLEANDCEVLRRFQIQYVIWDRKMWRSYGPNARQWLPYTGESAHLEHVHFSFTKAGRDGKTTGPRWAVAYALDHPEVAP